MSDDERDTIHAQLRIATDTLHVLAAQQGEPWTLENVARYASDSLSLIDRMTYTPEDDA